MVSSRLHFNSLLFILIGNVYLQDIEFSVQAALGIFNQSAIALIMFTVSEQVS